MKREGTEFISADDAENDGNSEDCDWYVSFLSPSYIHIHQQHRNFQSCGNSLKSQKLAICLSSTDSYMYA